MVKLRSSASLSDQNMPWIAPFYEVPANCTLVQAKTGCFIKGMRLECFAHFRAHHAQK